MKILALEFSSAQRTVALLRTDTAVVKQAIETGPGKNRPLAMIGGLLREASVGRDQIEVLAIGLGPGSYNGIRVAIALAQGWQLGRDVKLAGISSAAVVAAQAQSEGIRGPVTVTVDAQRGEFYIADYELTEQAPVEQTPLELASRETVLTRVSSHRALIGPELDRWFPQARVVWPQAAMLAKLAADTTRFVRGEDLQPVYLRQTTFVKAPPPRILPQ